MATGSGNASLGFSSLSGGLRFRFGADLFSSVKLSSRNIVELDIQRDQLLQDLEHSMEISVKQATNSLDRPIIAAIC